MASGVTLGEAATCVRLPRATLHRAKDRGAQKQGTLADRLIADAYAGLEQRKAAARELFATAGGGGMTSLMPAWYAGVIAYEVKEAMRKGLSLAQVAASLGHGADSLQDAIFVHDPAIFPHIIAVMQQKTKERKAAWATWRLSKGTNAVARMGAAHGLFQAGFTESDIRKPYARDNRPVPDEIGSAADWYRHYVATPALDAIQKRLELHGWKRDKEIDREVKVAQTRIAAITAIITDREQTATETAREARQVAWERNRPDLIANEALTIAAEGLKGNTRTAVLRQRPSAEPRPELSEFTEASLNASRSAMDLYVTKSLLGDERRDLEGRIAALGYERSTSGGWWPHDHDDAAVPVRRLSPDQAGTDQPAENPGRRGEVKMNIPTHEGTGVVGSSNAHLFLAALVACGADSPKSDQGERGITNEGNGAWHPQCPPSFLTVQLPLVGLHGQV